MIASKLMTRRYLLKGALGAGVFAGLEGLLPYYAFASPSGRAALALAAETQNLVIRETSLKIGDQDTRAVTINGTVPGPLLRFREGQDVTINVTNELDEDTSVHWHGLLVPANMDGVPKVSYEGIGPGETFTYRFPLKQSGTYWYHSHSGLQEQLGHFAPIIIDPVEPDPYAYDREYVVMLSDWTFEDPYKILKRLKSQSGYYNRQRQTMADFFRDVSEKGLSETLSDRAAWGAMRMDPTDIADITGETYSYLINGMPSVSNWTGLFKTGEKIRLRFINAATMSYFDVRIPGLKMTVVQADGQNIKPVDVDEFRIAVAETYDVIVEPETDQAYTIFAESMDRSGFARGTLAPRPGMKAEVPPRRPRPLRTMADMGMGAMSMEGMDKAGGGMKNMKNMPMPSSSTNIGKVYEHGADDHGAGSAMVSKSAKSRVDEPGDGLENAGHRVLAYSDLRNLVPAYDRRTPQREVELHLTGVMDRYMWSFDGKKFSEVKGPIPFYYGERLRLVLWNDTMMEHPIHLHGMWMELENGQGTYGPKKHTLNVKPGERLTALITADALGKWAFHCHLLYHMDMGMFRVVSVEKRVGELSK